ncbi:unnamed protein product [Leptidea sinapis]|uniref:PiggyBac transposable element-derived protein domain-containing protein n=1 Tax=Leptidea sinapis TaxID=189913 RepID=A0A5E4PP52_9NEOP|nr:unnamed protein product [Leptidea sinapis]
MQDEFTEWENTYLWVSSKTVVKLCKTIKDKPLSSVFFDNWITSLELVYYLRNEYGILSLGTIRKDRMRVSDMIKDKDLKKKGRGSHAMMTDNKNKITIVKWVDNDCVDLVSSYCGVEPVGTISRYDKEKKE